MDNDALWEELSLLAETVKGLERELARCAGPSPHKERLLKELRNASIRHRQTLAELCDETAAAV